LARKKHHRHILTQVNMDMGLLVAILMAFSAQSGYTRIMTK